MVDKSFLRGELFVLRCSFKNLLILRHILIGSLSYEGFYLKDRLDFPLAHGHRSVKPTRLGPSGPVFCFYLLHLYTFSHQKNNNNNNNNNNKIKKKERRKEKKRKKPYLSTFLFVDVNLVCPKQQRS